MNFNTKLWDETEAKEFGEFETLTLGGHETKIVSAEEYKSDQTGNLSLKICVDVCGKDKQKGFFTEQYNNNNNPDKKWPTGGTRYLSLKDENLAYLKGFITALENSNKDFKFDKNGTWDQLKGLKVASQFGIEEYKKEDGNISVRTKLVQFRSLDKLDKITIPDVKLIDGSYMPYNEYQEIKDERNSKTSTTVSTVLDSNIIEITDDFLD